MCGKIAQGSCGDMQQVSKKRLESEFFWGVSPKNEQKRHVWEREQRIRCAEQRLRELTVRGAGWENGKPTEPQWKGLRGKELLEQSTHQRLEWQDRDEITDLIVFLLKERGPFNNEKTYCVFPRFSAALSLGDIAYKFGLPRDNKSEMKIRGAYERVDRDIPGSSKTYKPKRLPKAQEESVRMALASAQCGIRVIVLERPEPRITENEPQPDNPKDAG
jgi:hypothetical protein